MGGGGGGGGEGKGHKVSAPFPSLCNFKSIESVAMILGECIILFPMRSAKWTDDITSLTIRYRELQCLFLTAAILDQSSWIH